MDDHGTPEGPVEHGTSRVKRGMAEMLNGRVIMDVAIEEKAKIAGAAGADAARALDRVPADIRTQVGVSHMHGPGITDGDIQPVSIPVMANARSDHFAEAQVLHAGRRVTSIPAR